MKSHAINIQNQRVAQPLAKAEVHGPCPGEIYGQCPAKRFSIALAKLPTKNDIAYYMQEGNVEGAVRAPQVEIQLLRDGVVAFSSGSGG